jgi:hypothetical protein
MRILLAATALAFCSVAGSARASVVDTYSFTQGGYSDPGVGSGGTLSGTFTGTVEANGYIELADVQSISATLTVGYLMRFAYGPPEFFSFLPGSDSTLDLETGTVLGGFLCVGAVAAFAFDQCGGYGGVNGIFNVATTQELPALTLISSVVTPAPPVPMPQPAPSTTPVPEPETLVLFATAVAGLAFAVRFGCVRRGGDDFWGSGGDYRKLGEPVRPRL